MGACDGWNWSQVGARGSHVAFSLAFFAFACGNSRSNGAGAGDDSSNSGGSGATAGSDATGGRGGSTGGSSGTDDPGGAAGASDDCAPTPLVQRRFVRLTDNQVVNSVKALAGADVAARAIADEEIVPLEYRGFPPLSETGNVINDVAFGLVDRIARRVGENARDDFDAVTSCGAAPTDDCARDYLIDFAERAYRRPLIDAERENFLTVYDECKSFGATIQEAVQHGLWAVLEAPGFVYRTELGDGDVTTPEVALTPYEMASELAFFLTDAPPDEELLDAASRGELSTPDEIGAHALRLVATAATRANFEAAMTSYFGLASVVNVVIDPESVSGVEVNTGLLNSMAHETDLFFENTLWTGALEDLLVSRRAFVNDRLATDIYGVFAPTVVDVDGFGEVELPEVRAGLLTSSAFLTRTSRPNGPSVVMRGMTVNAALACQTNPPFPEGNLPDTMPDPGASEHDKAAWRAAEPVCAGCHLQFDAYGLALDIFDGVGRVRTTDPEGRPIDPAVTLPETFENQPVESPAEMSAVIANARVYRACMAMNYMNYALSDESQGSARAISPNQPAASCHVDEVVRAFEASGDPSFSNLLVEIARSRLLRLRQGEP